MQLKMKKIKESQICKAWKNLQLKMKKSKESQICKPWSKNHGHDTYGNKDEAIEHRVKRTCSVIEIV